MSREIPRNLGLLFRQTAERFPNKAAFRYKEGGKYLSLTWEEFAKKTDAIASFFVSQGLVPGDRVAILSENRPEWAMVDLAAQRVGLVTVPVYTSLAPAEIQYLLTDSGAKFLAVSGKTLFEKVVSIQRSLPMLQGVIAFDTELSLSKKDLSAPFFLLKDTEKTLLCPGLDARLDAIPADAIASIIYTSGTTGTPKGVMLTHSNFIYNVIFSREALSMSDKEVALSFLPLCHVFERTAGYYLMIYLGATIAYAETMDTVPQNITEVRPTFLMGVPRFYEKIQSRVLDAVEKADPIRKALFFWAKELGRRKRLGKKGGLSEKLQRKLAQLLVYRTFNQRLGGRIRFCVSGGAPLAKDIAEFFHDLGMMIYEGYGLTETSPVISANRQERFKFGTVGIPLEGIQVKIDEEGEILTKGPCVMKGYHNKPAETNTVLKDGWFYTGDLGSIDKEGFLSITGRKKELIVTSGGKKVSPRAIEQLVEKDPMILRCVLFGEGKKFITALIVPQENKVTEYAAEEKIAFSSYEELLKNRTVYERVDAQIQFLMADLAPFERIKYFALLPHDFSQGSGELTPTLKVKRDVVWARYKDQLLHFYTEDKPAK